MLFPACAVASPCCWHWQAGVVFLQPLLSKEEHEPRKGKKSKFLLLWTVLPHSPVLILKEECLLLFLSEY